MKKEYHLIVYYLSFFVILIGFVQLIPLVVLPFYPDEIIYAPHFIVPGVLSILGGLVVRSCYKNFKIMQLPSFYDSIQKRMRLKKGASFFHNRTGKG